MPLRRRSSGKDPWQELGLHTPTILHHGREADLYRAKGAANDVSVVVKILAEPIRGRDEVERWRMLSSQQGILSLLENGVTEDGRPYAVMEESPRGSYADVLAATGPLPPAEVAGVGVRIAEALEAVHRHSLLHHAITPDNVLWTRFGAALIDFGSALPASHPFPPAYYGPFTVEHVPPEELAGETPSPASDVYRLAATLWHLLAGHPPFSDTGHPGAGAPGPGLGPTADTVAERTLRYPAPRVPRDDVPGWLTDALAHALDADPAGRPQSAERFGRILRQQEPPQLRPLPAAHWTDAPAPAEAEPASAGAGRERVAVPVPALAPAAEGEPGGAAPGPDEKLGESERPPNERLVHWSEAAAAPREPRRVLPLIAAAAALVAVAGGGAVVAAWMFGGGGEPQAGAAETEQEKRAADEQAAEEEVARAVAAEEERSAEPTVAPDAPSDVEIRDGTISATLTWTAATEAPHYIVGAPDGSAPQTMAHAAPGTSTTEVTGLNPGVDYCFRVVAVHAADALSHSEEVCTERD